MKKVVIKSLLLALPAFLVMSCKPTVKVSTDYDRSANFSAYKSFSLYYLLTSRNISELNEERIWNSIRTEMIRKGYVENNQNPDLVVNAVSVLKNKKYLSANSNFYGYGGSFRPYGYWNGGYRSVSGSGSVQAYDYKDGSLLIDVVDAKSKRLIWEGKATAELTKQPKNPDEAIQKTVSKILNDFPAGNALN